MRIVRAAGIVISLALVAVFGGGHLLRAAALAYPGPNGPGAFHLILLLLAAPVVVVSGIVLLLAPGVLPLAGTPQPSQGEVLLKGALVALVVDAAGFGLVKLVLGPEPSPAAFRGMAALLPVLGWVALLLQCRRAGPAGPEALRFLPGLALRVALVAGLAVLLLFPVLFWQDLNPDGLELFTAGRSLAQFLLPHLPTGRLPGLGLGMLTSAGLVHWFQVLFGTLDATARLPVVAALPLLYGATLTLIESGAARRAGLTERGLLLLALCALVATLVCNGTYHPYSADPASPSGVDVLLLAFLTMQVYFLWTEQPMWFLLATALAYLTRPTGLLLPLILGVAIVLAGGERRWARLRLVALGVLLCLLIQIGYERIYGALAGASFFEPSAEIGGRRLRYLSFGQWSRMLYVLLPSGVLPALSLLWWRHQDRLSRILTLSTVGYFGFFYFPSFTALHHFAPVMLLPLAVFWRLMLAR
ncbi:MAG TPA: hypothetical protein VNH46_06445, partial [Gemmatimonadales bacterium]|nr:hypothetical protein [Gemmatimonadales bacterium]